MKYLALDIGKRRTGAAFGDTSVGIPCPLLTIHHENINSLIRQTLVIIQERKIDHLIIGLPLLPSGRPGSQVSFVKQCIKKLEEYGVSYSLIDERYTTPKNNKGGSDAYAACGILETKFMKEKDI
ncbi:Holliday junction resolvase RuvX [Candidatus Peregrinibacteria bacterium]|nr:Holliday junction resolvase RuvX [Candidatus Peregrinibacteria bacterium]